MKKFLTIITSLAIAATITSCEGPAGPEGPMGPAGPTGPAGSYYYINKDYTIAPRDWVFEDGCYYCEISIPELTKDISETASINVYYYYGDYQKPLPVVQYESETGQEYTDPITGEIKSDVFYYSRLIHYDFTDGLLTLVITYSDFAEDAPKEKMDFRLVIHY
ncbi:MAG: collagen-like protein [Bacteroidales bacterium]|nr:collagen-like protein [Bacteroidales bacterium]